MPEAAGRVRAMSINLRSVLPGRATAPGGRVTPVRPGCKGLRQGPADGSVLGILVEGMAVNHTGRVLPAEAVKRAADGTLSDSRNLAPHRTITARLHSAITRLQRSIMAVVGLRLLIAVAVANAEVRGAEAASIPPVAATADVSGDFSFPQPLRLT